MSVLISILKILSNETAWFQGIIFWKLIHSILTLLAWNMLPASFYRTSFEASLEIHTYPHIKLDKYSLIIFSKPACYTATTAAKTIDFCTITQTDVTVAWLYFSVNKRGVKCWIYLMVSPDYISQQLQRYGWGLLSPSHALSILCSEVIYVKCASWLTPFLTGGPSSIQTLTVCKTPLLFECLNICVQGKRVGSRGAITASKATSTRYFSIMLLSVIFNCQWV